MENGNPVFILCLVIGATAVIYGIISVAAVAVDPILRKAFVNRWIGGAK